MNNVLYVLRNNTAGVRKTDGGRSKRVDSSLLKVDLLQSSGVHPQDRWTFFLPTILYASFFRILWQVFVSFPIFSHYHDIPYPSISINLGPATWSDDAAIFSFRSRACECDDGVEQHPRHSWRWRHHLSAERWQPRWGG